MSLVLILDNIRSAHNVGSIFRSAECFGVDEIILCGVTPAPVDRFGRENTKVTKVSLGTEHSIAWRSVKNTKEAIVDLKQQGFYISALEQGDTSINISQAGEVEKRVLVLGEETQGLSEEILKVCDEILEIPQKGRKESLNVSVATGIALYCLAKN